MRNEAFMNVRGALLTTSNTTGGDARTGIGGAEIQKLIDKMVVDNINRGVDFRPLVKRLPMPSGNLASIFNLQTDLGTTSKAAFYSDSATGTPYPSTRIQLFAPAKALRSDYEVTGLMIAASNGSFESLAQEMKDALDQLKLVEEKSMICGTDTNAYGYANAYLGLLQLMNSYVTLADTTTIHGIARANGKTYLDVSLKAATRGTSGTATGTLDLKDMDSAITLSNKAGGKDDERIFFVSEERGDEISQLLQTQQRFAGTLNLEGGFSVQTYKGIPVVRSRYMDKNGVTNTGSVDNSTDADNALYLLDLDFIEFRVVNGVDAQHVPIMGADASQRSDVQGGYFKTYGVLLMKNFNKQVLIWNLTAP